MAWGSGGHGAVPHGATAPAVAAGAAPMPSVEPFEFERRAAPLEFKRRDEPFEIGRR